jgi:hypothetical protein
MSALMNLKQARHSTLGDTIYAVAAAKFASEMTEDDSVGQRTSMYVTWRRTDSDPPEKPPGRFLDDDELKELRAVWEEHGRPKMPDASLPTLWNIVRRIKGARPGVSVEMEPGDMQLSWAAVSYLQKQEREAAMRLASQTSEDRQSPCDEACPQKDQHRPAD